MTPPHLNDTSPSGRSYREAEEERALLDTLINAFRGAFGREHVRGSRLNLEHASILRTLITTQQPLAVADLAGDTAELASLEHVLGERGVLRAWLGVPLMVRERVLGILSLASHEAGAYGAHAQARVQLFANQVALAIENARLYEHAREVAVTDNGRGFHLSATDTQIGALGNLRERAEAIGAVLDMVSQPGAGTTVRLSWSPPGNVRSATGDRL